MTKHHLSILYWIFFAVGSIAAGVGAALPMAAASKITMGAGSAMIAIAAEARRRMEGRS